MARRVQLWQVKAAARAKREGMIARRLGFPRSLNPFTQRQSYARDAWYEGWDEQDREMKAKSDRHTVADFIAEHRNQ